MIMCCREKKKLVMATAYFALASKRSNWTHLLCNLQSCARINAKTRGMRVMGGAENASCIWRGFANDLHFTKSPPWMWTFPTRLHQLSQMVEDDDSADDVLQMSLRCFACRGDCHARHHLVNWCCRMHTASASEIEEMLQLADRLESTGRFKCNVEGCKLCTHRICRTSSVRVQAVVLPDRQFNVGIDLSQSAAALPDEPDMPSEERKSFISGLSRYEHMWVLLNNVHKILLFSIPFVNEDIAHHPGYTRLVKAGDSNALAASSNDSVTGACMQVHKVLVAMWAARHYHYLVQVAQHFDMPLIDALFSVCHPTSAVQIIKSKADVNMFTRCLSVHGYSASSSAQYITSLAQIVEYTAERHGKSDQFTQLVLSIRRHAVYFVGKTNMARRTIGSMPRHFNATHLAMLTNMSTHVLSILALSAHDLPSLIVCVRALPKSSFEFIEACMMVLLIRSIGPQRRAVLSNLRFEQFRVSHHGARLIINNHENSIDKVTRGAVSRGQRELPVLHAYPLAALILLAIARADGESDSEVPHFVFSKSEMVAKRAQASPTEKQYVGPGCSSFNTYFKVICENGGLATQVSEEVHLDKIRQLVAGQCHDYNLANGVGSHMDYVFGHSALTARQYYGVPRGVRGWG